MVDVIQDRIAKESAAAAASRGKSVEPKDLIDARDRDRIEKGNLTPAEIEARDKAIKADPAFQKAHKEGLAEIKAEQKEKPGLHLPRDAQGNILPAKGV
jgi:hypothetical protein